MKKSILLVAMGLLLVNGCSNKTVTPNTVTSKVNKTTVSKKTVHKKVAHEKKVSEKTPKKVKQEKQWGAPTISEEEASKLYGFSVK